MSRRSDETADVAWERLQADYADKFFAAGATGFNAWANGAKIGVEINFGGIVGPSYVTSARYARRHGWLGLFGPMVSFRPIEDAESEVRQEVEAYLEKLKSGHKPKLFRE